MSKPVDATSLIVRGNDARPIGAVIRTVDGRFVGWNSSGKVGEYTTQKEANAAVCKAHFARRREEKTNMNSRSTEVEGRRPR